MIICPTFFFLKCYGYGLFSHSLSLSVYACVKLFTVLFSDISGGSRANIHVQFNRNPFTYIVQRISGKSLFRSVLDCIRANGNVFFLMTYVCSFVCFNGWSWCWSERLKIMFYFPCLCQTSSVFNPVHFYSFAGPWEEFISFYLLSTGNRVWDVFRNALC